MISYRPHDERSVRGFAITFNRSTLSVAGGFLSNSREVPGGRISVRPDPAHPIYIRAMLVDPAEPRVLLLRDALRGGPPSIPEIAILAKIARIVIPPGLRNDLTGWTGEIFTFPRIDR